MKTLTKLFKNSQGSTLVQVMVASAVVLGAAAYMMKSNQTQQKLQKGVGNKVTQSIIQKEISEALTNGDTCFHTLNKMDPVTAQTPLTGIYNKNDKLIYGVGSLIYNNKISEIKFENYSDQAGLNYQLSTMRVTVVANEAVGASMGGKSHSYVIPIFLITNDNKVDTCISNDDGSAVDVLRRACEDFKGTFNPTTTHCENFHGANGVVLNYVKEYLCSTGATCTHPYAGKVCTGKDVRGDNHGNWVSKGFDANGELLCLCVPVKCPDPSLYCSGRNLGTDWCQRVCPVGTKTNGSCDPGVASTPPPTPPTTPPPATPPPTTPPPTPPSTPPSGCFIAGTKVSLKDGIQVNIEDIVVGDEVQTYDEITHAFISRPVIKVFRHEAKTQELYEFTFSDGSRVTSNNIHPFYLVLEGHYLSAGSIFKRWKNAETIYLLNQSSKIVSITNMRKTTSEVEVYNLHVNGLYDTDGHEAMFNHNYFANGILVHNRKCIWGVTCGEKGDYEHP